MSLILSRLDVTSFGLWYNDQDEKPTVSVRLWTTDPMANLLYVAV